MSTQTRPPHRGMVNLGAHQEYMAAIDREDERLASIIGSIVSRTDAGELTTRAAALERVDALESHLAECQRLRRLYLSGS
jgi:hypothetical protein